MDLNAVFVPGHVVSCNLNIPCSSNRTKWDGEMAWRGKENVQSSIERVHKAKGNWLGEKMWKHTSGIKTAAVYSSSN